MKTQLDQVLTTGRLHPYIRLGALRSGRWFVFADCDPRYDWAFCVQERRPGEIGVLCEKFAWGPSSWFPDTTLVKTFWPLPEPEPLPGVELGDLDRGDRFTFFANNRYQLEWSVLANERNAANEVYCAGVGGTLAWINAGILVKRISSESTITPPQIAGVLR